MDDTLVARLARGGVVRLDGGLATTLARGGHDLGGALWSARLLVDDPAAIRAVHAAFLDAGAQVVTTASYQLAAASLAAAGQDPDAATDLLARSVALAREAVASHDGGGLVAASVGPYGAVLGGGAEYRGRYDLDVDGLRRFHAPRLEALLAAGPDVLACETVPSGAEIRALADLLRGSDVPAWLSLSVAADGNTTPEGQPLLEALAPALAVDEVVAVGVNCCAPATAARALVALASVEVPLVVYPNVGDRWDPAAGAWIRTAAGVPDPAPWLAAGARIVGGCCGTDPDDIAALGRHLA